MVPAVSCYLSLNMSKGQIFAESVREYLEFSGFLFIPLFQEDEGTHFLLLFARNTILRALCWLGFLLFVFSLFSLPYCQTNPLKKILIIDYIFQRFPFQTSRTEITSCGLETNACLIRMVRYAAATSYFDENFAE